MTGVSKSDGAASIEFDFLAPARTVFGWGRRREIGALAATLGRRAFLIEGSRTLRDRGVVGELIDALREAELTVVELGTVTREPLVEDIDRLSSSLRAQGVGDADLVVGVGGGAAVDAAKAVSAMATNAESQTVKDYLEGVGRGLQLRAAPLPLLALPTTAGTGSEATKNAVISHPNPAFKKSLRSDLMVPRVALIDPQLSVSVPATTTAHTGMDALTQLIESFISRRAKPMAQALALEGLRRGAPMLSLAVSDGNSRPAREAMSYAAYLSGLALANSGLGMAHGVAAALGVHCDVPHGLACAVMLPAALRANAEVCGERLMDVAAILCGESFATPAAAAAAAVESVEALCREVQIPQRLSDVGVQPEQLADIVAGSRGNSMNGNPRELSDGELLSILEGML